MYLCAANASIIDLNINSQFSLWSFVKIICSIHATRSAKGENEANIKLICFFNSVAGERECVRSWLLSMRNYEKKPAVKPVGESESSPYSLDTLTVYGNMKLHISRASYSEKKWFRLDLWYELAIFAHYIATFCACTNLNRNHQMQIVAHNEVFMVPRRIATPDKKKRWWSAAATADKNGTHTHAHKTRGHNMQEYKHKINRIRWS